MTRLCLDLNIWCAAFLADRAGRRGTAAPSLVDAVRLGGREIQLIVSWGMLERLRLVLVEQLRFDPAMATDLVDAIAGYAQAGPSLTLGGAGVIPIHDVEDQHVLETAWAGRADFLVTANLGDFVGVGVEVIRYGRLYRLRRGMAGLILAHPFEAARWSREGKWSLDERRAD